MKCKMVIGIFIVLLTFFSVSPLSMAKPNPYRVDLKRVRMNIIDQSFYIKEVIDGRKDKTNIGYLLGFMTKKPVVLEGGFNEPIQSFLNATLSQRDYKTPIIMKITVLRVSESSSLGRYIKAEVKAIFYRQKDGKLGRVFDMEVYLEKRIIDDGYYYAKLAAHEANIRATIENCIKSFSESNWASINPTWEDYQEIVGKTAVNEGKMTTTYLEQGNFITLEGFQDVYLTGGAVCWYAYKDFSAESQWVPIGSFEFRWILTEKNNLPWDRTLFIVSGGCFKRIGNSNFAIMGEGGVVIGHGDNGFLCERWFGGVIFEEGIIYIPKSEVGLVGYIGTYQFILGDTEIYPSCVGIKAGIGLKF